MRRINKHRGFLLEGQHTAMYKQPSLKILLLRSHPLPCRFPLVFAVGNFAILRRKWAESDTRAGFDSTAEVRDSAIHREVKLVIIARYSLLLHLSSFSHILFSSLFFCAILGIANGISINLLYSNCSFFSFFSAAAQSTHQSSSTPPSQPQGHGLSLAGWELAGQSIAQNFKKKYKQKEGVWRSGARAWERLTGYTKSRRTA